MTIPFNGVATPDVLAEVRALFLRRSAALWALYGAVIVVCIAAAAVRGVPSSRVFFVVVGAFVISLAIARPRTAWKQNETAWREVLRMQFVGMASDDNLWIEGTPERVAWSSVVAAKHDERVLLLYLSASDVLPLHRSFFASDAEWHQVIELARRKVGKWASRS